MTWLLLVIGAFLQGKKRIRHRRLHVCPDCSAFAQSLVVIFMMVGFMLVLAAACGGSDGGEKRCFDTVSGKVCPGRPHKFTKVSAAVRPYAGAGAGAGAGMGGAGAGAAHAAAAGAAATGAGTKADPTKFHWNDVKAAVGAAEPRLIDVLYADTPLAGASNRGLLLQEAAYIMDGHTHTVEKTRRRTTSTIGSG